MIGIGRDGGRRTTDTSGLGGGSRKGFAGRVRL